MKLNYKPLGIFIEEVDLKNTDLSESNLLGVSIDKKFIPSHANTIGTNFKNYKIVKYNQFAYGPVTSRNGDKISIALLKEDSAIISSSYKVFSIKDTSILNPDYLMLWFERPEFDRYARFHSHGSVREIFSWKKLCETNIPVPSLEIQKKIVQMVKVIENRISIKKKINHNLENQILNIFRKWFFKFEFPGKNFNNYKKDGLKFKETKSGPIPFNWELSYLGDNDFCPIIKSGINKFDNVKKYIATADVVDTEIINVSTEITFNNRPSRANMQPTINTIWFAKMKDSRKLILINDKSNYILDNLILSTGFAGLQCNEENLYYLWSFLLTNEFNTTKDNYCHGTTMQAINNKNINNIEIVIPNTEILVNFNNIAKPFFNTVNKNHLEIEKLKQFRSKVIPKLMLGEIDASKINI